MGVESYFINAKICNIKDIEEWKKLFKENAFIVSPYIEEYGWIFPKKIEQNNKIVINKIVLFSYYEDSISFEACFSCYEKSISLILYILSRLNDNKLIQYIYYGTTQFDPQKLSFEKICVELRTINQKRLDYFKENYTTNEIEILPHKFYWYYNKHRKELKQK